MLLWGWVDIVKAPPGFGHRLQLVQVCSAGEGGVRLLEGCVRAAPELLPTATLPKRCVSHRFLHPSPSRPPPGWLRHPLCFDSLETGGARIHSFARPAGHRQQLSRSVEVAKHGHENILAALKVIHSFAGRVDPPPPPERLPLHLQPCQMSAPHDV